MPAPCVTTLADTVINNCVRVGPGFASLKATVAAWIDAFPAVDTTDTDSDGIPDNPQTITGDITLDTVTYTGARWASVELSVDQNSFLSEQDEDTGTFNTTITGVIRGVDPTTIYQLNKMSKQGMVLTYTDDSGQERVVGNPNNPAKLRFNDELGAATGDLVGQTITITWSHGEPAPFYGGTAL